MELVYTTSRTHTTFPSRDKILSDLQMSKNAYYKHFRQLTDQGYISVYQERKTTLAFSNNVYTLVSNPKKFDEKPEDVKHSLAYSRIRFSGLKSAGYGIIPKAVMVENGSEILCTKKQDTEKQDSVKQDSEIQYTEKQDTLYQQPAKPEYRYLCGYWNQTAL